MKTSLVLDAMLALPYGSPSLNPRVGWQGGHVPPTSTQAQGSQLGCPGLSTNPGVAGCKAHALPTVPLWKALSAITSIDGSFKAMGN